jgi:hypothetical protein
VTVYFDSIGHMVADTEEELHAFAKSIGMKIEWHQCRGSKAKLPHYDLMYSRIELAEKNGAVKIPVRQLLERCKIMKRESE